jgi:hypothetical protein
MLKWNNITASAARPRRPSRQGIRVVQFIKEKAQAEKTARPKVSMRHSLPKAYNSSGTLKVAMAQAE